VRLVADWYQIPPGFHSQIPEMPGVHSREIHRSHLPLLNPDVRDKILAGAPPVPPRDRSRDDAASLRQYQRQAAEFARERQGCILALDMGCVAGDSILTIRRAGISRKYPVRYVYRRLKRIIEEHPGKGTFVWRPEIPTTTKSLCDGELRHNLITEIIAKGIQPVVKLTLASGKFLRLTPDHEVARADGSWSPVEKLSHNDLVLTNGQKWDGTSNPNWKRGTSIDQDGYVRVSGCWDHPRCWSTGQVYEHILVVERRIGRYLTADEEVHHKNKNRADNQSDNLELVDKPSHSRRHHAHLNMEGATGRRGTVRFIPLKDAVVSVEPDGETDVYDLVMADPYRNFVANGIVVHNCGKTRTSLAATYAPGKIGVVVAPLVAWPVWRKEIKVVYGEDYPVVPIRGRRLTGVDENLHDPGIYLLNPEIVYDRWTEWYTVRPAFVILDEAHLYIGRKTKRHQGAENLAGCAQHRIALTGTPVLRHIIDLHGILRCVCPGAFGSWYDLAMDLGGMHGQHGVELDHVPADRRKRFEDRLAEVMLKCRWEEVAKDIPTLQRERIPVVLPPAAAAEYNRLATDVRRVLGNRVVYDGLLRALAMMEVGALRRFIGRAKIQAVIDLACSTQEPVVVWTWHRDVAKEIAAGIHKQDGSVTEVITGEDSQDKRDAKIEKFQQGKTRVVCVTMAAAGLGIDFTVARFSIFAELDYTPAVMAQAERRVWRSGQTKPCITYWPVVAGSIEESILDILWTKERFADSRLLAGITKTEEESGLHSIIDLVDMIVG
jgi:hypothetical protein